jgi:hypothetical protein
MIFRIRRCVPALRSTPLALAGSCLLLSVSLVSSTRSFADTVHDHNREHYGRVSAISAAGVTLLRGCSGSAPEVIPLSDLEEIDFGGKCAPNGLSSSSSPSTAACTGAQGCSSPLLPNRVQIRLYLWPQVWTFHRGRSPSLCGTGRRLPPALPSCRVSTIETNA